MDSPFDWLTSKFKQQPLSLAFFVFGAILVLLGITGKLNIPYLGSPLAANEAHQVISIALGSCLLVIAIFVYYHPPAEKRKDMPAPDLVHEDGAGNVPIPDDLRDSFSAKREALGYGSRQAQILDFVVSEARRDTLVSLETVVKKFNQLSGSEVYYRLEHLRLLCFIEKAGKNVYEQERKSRP
jgi:hypothetical protein